MTRQRSFKRLVRTRMEKTGESYTAARAMLLGAETPAPVLATSDAAIRERTATRPRSARFDWDDDGSRVSVVFDARDDGRSAVFVEHSRLEASARDRMKARWREHLAALKVRLEGGDA